MPAFKRTTLAYYAACERLSFRLLDALATNLRTPVDDLHRSFQPAHTCFLRINYYPVCPAPALDPGPLPEDPPQATQSATRQTRGEDDAPRPQFEFAAEVEPAVSRKNINSTERRPQFLQSNPPPMGFSRLGALGPPSPRRSGHCPLLRQTADGMASTAGPSPALVVAPEASLVAVLMGLQYASTHTPSGAEK